ncbi:MAG TPA: 1-acyl-sn-glycerol-3-phosphate acyltransferase [Gemmatimonadaceae bacterium]|nr:1-acyl-sn-glycerol-3-phosphate acyltransferase [Gemmatimonadaceae bacterium]
MLYRLLRAIATLAVRWYYRRIEVEGLDRIPRHGAAILAANHWNALVDALLVGTTLARPVRLTAKATLLEHPVTRLIVHAVGIVPLRRVSDERQRGDGQPAEARNAQSFAALLDALAAGELVLIFPEGKSHSDPELAPLKTGCARLALLARTERGLAQVPIIPVGLTFERKGAPRSRVALQIGAPVTADDLPGASPQDVQTLTARLDEGLRRVTLNVRDREAAGQVLEVSALLNQLLDRVRPLHAPDAPLADAVRIAQRLEAARQLLPAAPAETVAQADAFLTRLEAFRTRMRAADIPINDLWMPVSLPAGSWFAVREGVIALTLAPLALWGRLNHWVPITLARWVGRATSKNPDEPAMHTLVAGLLLVMVCYALVALFIGHHHGMWWALAYVASLPPSASLDFWLSDRLRRARRRARAYLTLRGDPALRTQLRREASDLRSEARRLDAALR